jgi:hypothetical protein
MLYSWTRLPGRSCLRIAARSRGLSGHIGAREAERAAADVGPTQVRCNESHDPALQNNRPAVLRAAYEATEHMQQLAVHTERAGTPPGLPSALTKALLAGDPVEGYGEGRHGG